MPPTPRELPEEPQAELFLVLAEDKGPNVAAVAAVVDEEDSSLGLSVSESSATSTEGVDRNKATSDATALLLPSKNTPTKSTTTTFLKDDPKKGATTLILLDNDDDKANNISNDNTLTNKTLLLKKRLEKSSSDAPTKQKNGTSVLVETSTTKAAAADASTTTTTTKSTTVQFWVSWKDNLAVRSACKAQDKMSLGS